MKRWHFITLAGLLLNAAVVSAAQVGLIKIDGAIGPATASYISRAIDTAAAQNDECLIIQLDTPGGLLNSMQKIVEKNFEDRVPVVVFVAPSGAMATSAGCYITMSANIAAMAPDTTIGAAHPVDPGGRRKRDKYGRRDEAKAGKVGVGYLDTIANKRHRNANGPNPPPAKAIPLRRTRRWTSDVIDLIAKDVPDLLQQLEGREVNGKTLRTANAQVVEMPMTPCEHCSSFSGGRK